MMKYKKIMVAVDGSTTSDQALQEAVELAQDQKAFLRIIYVVDESIVKYADSFIDFETLWAAFKAEGQALLKKISHRVKASTIHFDTHLVILKFSEGRLAEKIVSEAEDWQADLLVIGTHGRQGISRFFLGSVAEKVLRIATLPVLLIRG
ncbi:universal stress protein [Legionella sp.]|uniref:universal stress protein n=1 Tax=Legionella sp. TaxID=459 RepID=UPI00321FD564